MKVLCRLGIHLQLCHNWTMFGTYEQCELCGASTTPLQMARVQRAAELYRNAPADVPEGLRVFWALAQADAEEVAHNFARI